MSPRHARSRCLPRFVGRVRIELDKRHRFGGYTALLRGELNMPCMPDTPPQQHDSSAPTPDLLRAVLDGLRKL